MPVIAKDQFLKVLNKRTAKLDADVKAKDARIAELEKEIEESVIEKELSSDDVKKSGDDTKSEEELYYEFFPDEKPKE